MKIIVFGSHFFGKALLDFLIDQPDIEVPLVVTDNPSLGICNAKGRLWSHGWTDVVKNLVPSVAKQHGIPVYDGKIAGLDFLNRIGNLKPAGVLSSCFGQILPSSILKLVKHQAFNLHPVVPGEPIDLTAGPKPFHAATEAASPWIQMAVHQMHLEADQGPILARGKPIWLANGLFDAPANVQIPMETYLNFYSDLADTTAGLMHSCFRELFQILTRA